VCWRGLLVCAVDGTLMALPDSEANLTVFTKHRCNNGGAGYPTLRLLVLVCCGTRTLLNAVFGPANDGEDGEDGLCPAPAAQPARGHDRPAGPELHRPGAGDGHHRYRRAGPGPGEEQPPTSRPAPPWRRSFLSMCGTVPVRVIDCKITLTTATGRTTAGYRLITGCLGRCTWRSHV
jgi:hypothetical protein